MTDDRQTGKTAASRGFLHASTIALIFNLFEHVIEGFNKTLKKGRIRMAGFLKKITQDRRRYFC